MKEEKDQPHKRNIEHLKESLERWNPNQLWEWMQELWESDKQKNKNHAKTNATKILNHINKKPEGYFYNQQLNTDKIINSSLFTALTLKLQQKFIKTKNKHTTKQP